MVGSCVELAVRTDGINTPAAAAATVELVVTVDVYNSDTHRH